MNYYKTYLSGLLTLNNKIYTYEIISAVISAFITFLIASLLGPEKQGEWALYNQFINLIITLVLGGLPATLLILLRKREIIEKELFIKLLRYCLFGSAAVISICIIVSGFSYAKIIYSPLPLRQSGFFLLAYHVFINMIMNFVVIWMDSKSEIRRVSFYRMVSNIILLLVIGWISYFKPGVQDLQITIWIIFLIWQSLFVASLIKVPRQTISGSGNGSSISLFHLFTSQGWIILLSGLFQFLNYRIDLWMMSGLSTSNQTGIYSVAAGMSMYLMIIPRNSQRILINKFVNEDRQDSTTIRNEIIQIFRTGLILIPLTLFLGFIVFQYFLAQEYQSGYGVFCVLLAGMGFLWLTMPYSAYFLFVNKQKFNLFSSLTGLFFNIAANYYLIPKIGMWGAAWSSLATYFLVSLSLYLYYQKCRPQGWL